MTGRVWFCFSCDRCGRLYRTCNHDWHCFGCTVAAQKHGLAPLQAIGEMSGGG